MTEPRRTEYLERETYRQRRFRDAARVLPFVTIVLFLLPMLWPWPDAAEGLDPIPPSRMLLYIFGAWLVVTAVAALIARVIRFSEPAEEDAPEERGAQ